MASAWTPSPPGGTRDFPLVEIFPLVAGSGWFTIRHLSDGEGEGDQGPDGVAPAQRPARPGAKAREELRMTTTEGGAHERRSDERRATGVCQQDP